MYMDAKNKNRRLYTFFEVWSQQQQICSHCQKMLFHKFAYDSFNWNMEIRCIVLLLLLPPSLHLAHLFTANILLYNVLYIEVYAYNLAHIACSFVKRMSSPPFCWREIATRNHLMNRNARNLKKIYNKCSIGNGALRVNCNNALSESESRFFNESLSPTHMCSMLTYININKWGAVFFVGFKSDTLLHSFIHCICILHIVVVVVVAVAIVDDGVELLLCTMLIIACTLQLDLS